MDDHDNLSRWPIYLSLCLAVGMVAVVLVGARMVSHQPIVLSEVDAQKASSDECSSLIDALPGKAGGQRRAKLAEPAPAGSAAWSSSTTLRCGVDLPAQYTTLMHTQSVDGVEWLPITDADDEGRATWYSVNRTPVVAVTSDADVLGDLSPAVAELKTADTKPAPAPLSELPAKKDERCQAILKAMPQDLAGMELQRVDDASVAWVSAEDNPRPTEPIVARCGVALPKSYQPGARLTQVNDTAWFFEGPVAYSVDHSPVVAVHASPAAGNAPLVRIGRALDSLQAGSAQQ